MALIFLAVVSILVIVTLYITSDRTNESGQGSYSDKSLKLLDLNSTTLSQRQHYYQRSFKLQMQYDELQRRAEASGDTATLEALRLRIYDGPLPVIKDDTFAPVLRVSTRVKSSRQSIANPKVQNLRYFCVKDKGYHVSVWPKDQGVGDCVEFNIAGITYVEDVDNYLGESVGGLIPEPDNQYDPDAIEIVASDGHHLGYVPKDMTDEVRKHTQLPATCYVYIGQNPDDGAFYTCCYYKL